MVIAGVMRFHLCCNSLTGQKSVVLDMVIAQIYLELNAIPQQILTNTHACRQQWSSQLSKMAAASPPHCCTLRKANAALQKTSDCGWSG